MYLLIIKCDHGAGEQVTAHVFPSLTAADIFSVEMKRLGLEFEVLWEGAVQAQIRFHLHEA